ncbi:translation initiation factor IF-2 subunit beta [Candidatus Micrarchaeota archaeon]|nr:translation initiation factor IF-2 subunit beta [Candidatus Micrarchaeota archaeon]
MNYENMLTEVYASLPEKKSSGERFEVPIADAFIEGNKTLIRNFDAICQTLRRKPADLAKFLFRELAVPGVMEGGRLLLQTKVSDRLINEKIGLYAQTHVICHECHKPDTSIESHGRSAKILICEACGARSPVLV